MLGHRCEAVGTVRALEDRGHVVRLGQGEDRVCDVRVHLERGLGDEPDVSDARSGARRVGLLGHVVPGLAALDLVEITLDLGLGVRGVRCRHHAGWGRRLGSHADDLHVAHLGDRAVGPDLVGHHLIGDRDVVLGGVLPDLSLVDQLRQRAAVYRRLALVRLNRANQRRVLVARDLALVAQSRVIRDLPRVYRQVEVRPVADRVLADGLTVDRRDGCPMVRVVAGDDYPTHQRQRGHDGQREAERHIDRSPAVVATDSAAGWLRSRSGAEGHLGVLVRAGSGKARRVTEPYATAFRFLKRRDAESKSARAEPVVIEVSGVGLCRGRHGLCRGRLDGP